MEIDEDGFQKVKASIRTKRRRHKELQAKLISDDVMTEKEVTKLREMVALEEMDITEDLAVDER